MPTEPRAIAHFDVLARLGAGGMGVVYRAHDRVLGREVALKLVRPEHAGDTHARQRFLREARAAAALTHPGIAIIYEAGEATVEGVPSDGEARGTGPPEPQLYIAQELVPGEPLAARVRLGPMAVEEVRRLGIQLAEALGAAHEQGIVHRDVKPSNLMVTPQGAVKVLDFGLARHRAWTPPSADAHERDTESWPQTEAGTVVGTPGYMAPEQVAGGPLSASADVYAAGCVLYALLVGRPPHEGASTVEVLRRVLTETPRSVRDLRPDVPPGLAAVVSRALAREPGERFPNGHDLAAALRDADCPETVALPRSRRLRAVRPRVWRAATAALVLVTAGLAAWIVAGRGATPALAFRERDFVLVADVVNSTGEPVFDLALKTAIETDLRQSRFVNVLDPTQVQNTLRLMRLEADAPIDERVGRDVSRRAGARALVVPRIVRAGEAYRVGALLIEPATGRVVAEAAVTVRGREEVLLTAIDALSRQLRERLGESMDAIAKSDPPFVQYTSSSLDALSLADQGRRAWGAGEFAKAERYFREALQHDPRFAAARGSLGLVLIQFTGKPDEGKQLLAQALADAGEVSQREHLHLRALNRQFVAGDLEGALEDYRFISDLYPDLLMPWNNSGRILAAMGRLREAEAMYERAHRVDPQSPVPLWNLWWLAMQRVKDPQTAERSARALVALLPDNAMAAHALAWSLVMARRFPEAEQAMRATLAIDAAHIYALPNLGHLLLRRGAASEAEVVYRDTLDKVRAGTLAIGIEHPTLSLALALTAGGKAEEATRLLGDAADALQARHRTAAPSLEGQAQLAVLLAAGGQHERARRLASRVAADARRSADATILLAEVYALLADLDRAVALYAEACDAGYGDPYFILIDPALAAIRDAPVVDRVAPAIATTSAQRIDRRAPGSP